MSNDYTKVAYLSGSAVAAVALMVGTAVPATAATADTSVTLVLDGGTLAFAVQGSASMTGTAGGLLGTTITGPLGGVKVTDNRAGSTPWSASASSTAFTSATTPAASTSVKYTAGVITTGGTIVILPGVETSLTTTPAKVAGPTAVIGNNTASWNPQLAVALPAEAAAGTYTGTITTSVA